MNRKLATELSQCVTLISQELQKFTSQQGFIFGYFYHNRTDVERVYFTKKELDAGMKNSHLTFPLYKNMERMYSVSQKLNSFSSYREADHVINSFSSFNFLKFEEIDFFNDQKREDIKELCRIADVLNLPLRRAQWIAQKLFNRSIQKVRGITERDITIPFVSMNQDLKEFNQKNYFTKKFKEFDAFAEELRPYHPYSPIWKKKNKISPALLYDYEYVLLGTIKKLMQLQLFIQKSRIVNLPYYYLLHKPLRIPPVPTKNTLLTYKTKYQRELIELPVTVISLSNSKQMDYTQFFNRVKTSSRYDNLDEEILLQKDGWTELHNCMSMKEFKETLQRLTVDPANYFKLSHPYFPFIDSDMQSILKFLHCKLIFLENHFEKAIESFPYTKRLDQKPKTKEHLIQGMIEEYEQVLKSNDTKLSISPSLKLPKRISDHFIRGVLLILKTKLQESGIKVTEEINMQKDLFLHYPYKFYWDKVANKYDLKEVMKPLYTIPIGGGSPGLTEDQVDLIIEHFFSFKSKSEFITPRTYLNIERNTGCPIAVIRKFFYDLWVEYFPKEPLDRFTQLMILAFSGRDGKNRSVDKNDRSFKNVKSNMNQGHDKYMLKVIKKNP